jgi:16S rRNA (cytosine967-C5)-methyltransferase
VYSTCTISEHEGEGAVAGMLDRDGAVADNLGAEHPGHASPRDPRFLQVRPDRDRTDGFFIARMRKP